MSITLWKCEIKLQLKIRFNFIVHETSKKMFSSHILDKFDFLEYVILIDQPLI